MAVMKKVVWLAILWIAVTIVFPEISRYLPPPLLVMTYVVAGALIVTGREHIIMFFMAFTGLLLEPLKPVFKLIEVIWDMLEEV